MKLISCNLTDWHINCYIHQKDLSNLFFNPNKRDIFWYGGGEAIILPLSKWLCRWILQILFLQFLYLEKGALELCRAATIKLRQIEHSGFFLLDHNGQTWIYRLVWGLTEVRFRRNFDFPIGGGLKGPPPYLKGLRDKRFWQDSLTSLSGHFISAYYNVSLFSFKSSRIEKEEKL